MNFQIILQRLAVHFNGALLVDPHSSQSTLLLTTNGISLKIKFRPFSNSEPPKILVYVPLKKRSPNQNLKLLAREDREFNTRLIRAGDYLSLITTVLQDEQTLINCLGQLLEEAYQTLLADQEKADC